MLRVISMAPRVSMVVEGVPDEHFSGIGGFEDADDSARRGAELTDLQDGQ